MSAWASPAWATPFNFDITFNGTTATMDLSSDPIAGTGLVPGDTFALDIHADVNDYWQVNTSFQKFLYATLFVQDGGIRTGNITTTLFLDGVQVAQQVQLGESQQFIHIGGQTFNFVAGTQFDQLVVDYTFLATTSTFTTLQAAADGVAFFPFFRDSNISYVQGASVPEPSTLFLFAAGLATLARRRSRG